MMNGLNGMGWGMGFGWLIGLVVLVGFIWIIVRFFQPNNNFPNQRNEKTALDILKENYAKGLISKEEFEQKKKDILS